MMPTGRLAKGPHACVMYCCHSSMPNRTLNGAALFTFWLFAGPASADAMPSTAPKAAPAKSKAPKAEAAKSSNTASARTSSDAAQGRKLPRSQSAFFFFSAEKRPGLKGEWAQCDLCSKHNIWRPPRSGMTVSSQGLLRHTTTSCSSAQHVHQSGLYACMQRPTLA